MAVGPRPDGRGEASVEAAFERAGLRRKVRARGFRALGHTSTT
jgi:hypothetical protein